VLSLLAAVTLTALALTSVTLTRLSAVLLLSVLRALAVLLVLAVRLVVLRTHCVPPLNEASTPRVLFSAWQQLVRRARGESETRMRRSGSARAVRRALDAAAA
jgi:hypothetical protein